MKIAFISSLNGGVKTFTVGLVKELANHVEKVDLFLFSDHPPDGEFKLPDNVEVIFIERNGILLLAKLFLNINKLKTYDLIHLNYSSLFMPIYIIKKLWGIPYIYTSHGCPHPELEKGAKRILYIFESHCLKITSNNAAKHVTISRYARDELEKKYNVKPMVIYHGIYLEEFSYNEKYRKNLRKSLSVSEDQFIILFTGAFSKAKNIFTLINSVPYILKSHHNFKILLIGSGELYGDLLYKIAQLGIGEFVIIKSWLPNVCEYYSAADIFVLPSIKEMFGFVLLEAMAAGVPVIASRGGACPEILGDAGLIFDTNSSEDLGDKILELMNNKNLYKDLKESGLKRAKLFLWGDAAKKYYDIYVSSVKL